MPSSMYKLYIRSNSKKKIIKIVKSLPLKHSKEKSEYTLTKGFRLVIYLYTLESKK